MAHIFRFGSIEWHYFSYGFDVKRFRNQREYMDEAGFIWQNNMLNMVQVDIDYTCILRDKTLFAEVLSMWGYNVPYSLASIQNNADAIEFVNGWKGKNNLFCKPINGQCGQGTFKVIVSTDGLVKIDGLDYSLEAAKIVLIQRLSTTPYIIQNIIEQLPEITAIYPHALNTLRITTYYDKNQSRSVPFAAFFRTGASGGEVDNWAIGGVLIGMDLFTGELNKYGFFKHGNGRRIAKHPDTGFVFEGFKMPLYEQALHEAVSLHDKLNGIPVIGWDIALTKDGPLFIEGNDNIEIGPIQIAVDRGLKKDFIRIKKSCMGS